MIIEATTSEYKDEKLPISSLNSVEQTENCEQLAIISKQITKNKKIINNRKKRLQRVNWLDIQFPFKHKNVFYLPGHIHGEIYPNKGECIQLSLKKALKTDQFFTLFQSNLELHTQFEEVIYLLENSQSQQNYDVSQQLRKYQKINENQNNLIKLIKQQADFDKIWELQKERQKFKDNYIVQYNSQNFTEDDFYVIRNIGINIDKEQSDLKQIHFSKSYFALIGLDEQFFWNMYVRKLLLFLVIPPHTRRIIFMELLSNYISDKSPYTKQVVPIEFHTLDKIKIQCNMEFQFIEIPYPDHLKNVYLDSLHLSMDNIFVAVLHVQDHHLKKVLEQRTKSPIKHLEDLEYTIFSEIFLEKFYPKQLTKLQQKQIQEENEEKGIDIQKRCTYKYINQDN